MNRRDFLRIGGLGLCGITALDVLRAHASPTSSQAKAKQLIVCWLGGGPPHIDMFDMKPDAPADYRGDFKPIDTSLPGLQVCELMPELAKRAHKYTVLRSVTSLNKPGGHGGHYWLTGNPRLGTGGDEFPMFGSVISKLRPGEKDLPTFIVLDDIDPHSHHRLGQSFLGPAYAPLIMQPLREKDVVTKMLTPQLELPALAKNAELLQRLDTKLRRVDVHDQVIAGLDEYQKTAFNLLQSPRLRKALDLSKESPETVARYRPKKMDRGRYALGDPLHFLLARRLIEAGVPIVHFNLGYWDWHVANFVAGRQQIPPFDAGLAALLDDLDERGLLDSTIVLALGEMGRRPRMSKADDPDVGRDHWDTAQFVLAAGGGFKRGCVVGATNSTAEEVTDKLYKIESFGRTLYHLLGIDPDTTVHTPSNRPVKLIVEKAPVIQEAII